MSLPDATLFEALVAVNRSAEQQNADITLHLDRLAQLRAQTAQASGHFPLAQVPSVPQATLPLNDYHPTIELCNPPMFNGAADNVESFLHDIEVHFRLQCATLCSDVDKVYFFSMYLGSGSPESWFNAVTRQRPSLLADWLSLKADFIRRFQSHNLVAKYTRKLEALWQEDSAADFANQFQEYLAYVDWSEQVKIWEFDCCLKADLRRLLVNDHRPPTLEEWIPLVVEADNRLCELETELDYDSSRDMDVHASPSPSRLSMPSERPDSPPPSFLHDDNLDPDSQTLNSPSRLPSPRLDYRTYRPLPSSTRDSFNPPSFEPSFEPSPSLEPGPNDPVPMDVDSMLRSRRY